MLQLWTSFLGVALLFICQCSVGLGSSLDGAPKKDFSAAQGAPDPQKQALKLKQASARLHVSNAAAADWLEKALWGPAGASRWRHHSLLRLKNLRMLHVLPEEPSEDSNGTEDSLQIISYVPPGTVSAAHAQSESEEDYGSDQEAAQGHADDYDDEDNQDGDDKEDVLSTGLRNVALEREHREYLKEVRAKRQAARAAAKAKRTAAAIAARTLAMTRQATRRHLDAVKASKSDRARAEAQKRAGAANQQINVMLKQVVEELELDKSRCQTYMATAKKEALDAREISMEDQERLAYMETTLHASRTDRTDIESQQSDLAEELQRHKARCAADMGHLRSELSTLKTDANTTAKLMQASPCKGKTFLLECNHNSARKPYIASRHGGLRQVMAQLSTSTARRSLQRALRRSVASKHEHEMVLLQRTHHRRLRHRSTRQHSRHRTDNSCKASRMDCQVVETAVVLMMADVQDKQHTTKVALDKASSQCDAATGDFEREFAHFERQKELLSQRVAQTMAERSGLTGEASLRLQEYEHLTQRMTDVRKECESSVQAYEKQACTLRRTRKEVLVNNGVKTSPDALRDCEVSPWAPAESCSEECGGGVQRLLRTVVVPNGDRGMPCPNLETKRACNVQSCPVNCEVTGWTSWTQCSAMCSGGTRSRTRRVIQMAEHGGEICPGENSISESCNAQPCVPDCVLSAWAPWSGCSRACNGGYQRRTRLVSAPARGNALCPSEEQRSEYLKCKSGACPVPKKGHMLKCNSSVDLIVVLDGSASVSKKGFDDAKVFVTSLMKALNLGAGKGQAAVVLAGGPNTWKAFEKCKLEGSSEGALKNCNVEMSLPLSASESEATSAVKSLVAPGGPAYTAGALSLAASQAEQSRQDGAAPVVLVVGHGQPLSESRTSDEAANIREKARLMWLVVGGAHPEVDTAAGSRTLSAQLAATWASRPYSDNVFQVDNYKALLSLDRVSEVVSAVCPSVEGSKAAF